MWVIGVARRGEDIGKVWRGDDLRRNDEYEISSIDFLFSSRSSDLAVIIKVKIILIYEALGLIIHPFRVSD